MGSGEFREHLSSCHGDAEEFSCAHCGHKSYTDECHFRHMLGHSKFSSFVLYSCGFPGCLYGTNVKDMFLDHWKKFHPNAKSFKCISCREVFPAVEELVIHLQSNILKFVQCPHCTVKDRNRRVILSHIAEIHPGKPRQITVTSQLVCQEREINSYVAPHTISPPQSFQPAMIKIENDTEKPTADYADDNSENITSEQKNDAHTDTAVEKRHIKGQSAEHHMREVERVLSLDKHRIRLQNSVVLRCPHCTYLASGKGLLKKHLLCHRRGPQRDRPFACPYCPSSMDKLSKLSVHLNLHEGTHKVKVYFCGFCSLKTNVREKMLSHGYKTHKKDFTLFTDVTTKVIRIKVTAFFCDQCECGFRDKTAYDHHMWTHSDEAKSSGNPAAPPERPHLNPNNLSAVVGPHPLPRSFEFLQKSAHNVNQSPSSSFDNTESPILDEMKRFRCKECGKCMSRLPVLKQHMLCHILNQDLELIVFKCSYCAFTSTSKLLVSQHSQEKHPDKLVRVKRRIDLISASDSAHYYNQPIITNQSSETDLSIDSFHCDLCSYSCSNAAVLQRHKTAEHPESLGHENFEAARKKFIIPYGNVYKNPVFCSECPYSTKTRLDLLRHIKIHPHLLPETEFSPPKEKPKQLLKVAIGKRRPQQLDFYEKSSPSPEKISNMSSPDQEDKKPVLLENGAVEGYTPKPPTILQSSLYFLGGDLLHLKLRPCFSQMDNGVEHMCLLCEESFAGKYLLHKHILQHMEVYFYKCAYCDHGTLESSAMMVHIQKVHHKPIQHTKIEVTDLESKINKFIHNIKEREYSGNVQMDYDDNNSQDTLPQDDDGDDTETSFPGSNSSSPVNTTRSPTESFQHSFTLPKLTSPKQSKALIPVKPVSPADIHPNIKKMGDIYKCKVCGYTTTARTTIVQHLTIHSSFKRFGCPFCQYRSHWRHDTIKHIRTHHPDKHGEPTKDDPPNSLDSPSPPMPKLSPQMPLKPKVSPASGINEAADDTKENESEYTGGFRHVYKCLLCDAKFRSKWKIFRHFSTSCSQPMLGCSKCKFKDQEPSVVKTHIIEKHANVSEEARIISLTRDAKMRKYSIPLINTKSQDKIKLDEKNETFSEVNNKTRLPASSWNLSTLVKRIGNHYKCKECGFTGGNKATIVRHAKRHKIGQIYKCSYCEYKSNLQCNVKRHMQNLHPAEPNVITFLSSKDEPTFVNNLDDEIEFTPSKAKQMASMESQDENVKSKQLIEPKNYWKCLECGYKANCLGSVYRHFKKAGCLKTMYGCSACKFKSFDRSEVQRHVENENPSKSAELLVCPSSAKIKKIHNLAKPTKNIRPTEKDKEKDGTKLKDIFCPVCHLKASNENVFQTHLNTEHFGQVMMCSYCCCFRTRDVVELQKHTDSTHQGNTIKFQLRSSVDKQKPGNLQCPKCDYAGRRADLKNHLYCHIDYKPFCCPYCQYRCRKSTVITSSHIPRFHPGKPERVLRKTSIAKEKEVDALLASVSAYEQASSFSSSEVERKPVVEHQPLEDKKTIISTKVERLGSSNIDGLTPSKLYKAVVNPKSKKETYQCLKCRFTTAIKSTMVSHTYNHMPYIFRCPYCEYQTYPRSMVTKHIKARHPSKTVYVIDERSKNREFLELAAAAASSDSSSPEKHEPAKKRRKLLGLDSDIFSDEASSDEEEPKHKVPKRIDNGRILYCCHLCPFTNESCYHYRQHLATHGGFRWQVPGTKLETKLKCGYCSYLAIDDQEFTRHMEVHLTSRPFNCPYCDFSQYTQCKVKYHITMCHPDKEVFVKGSNAGTSHSNLNSVMLVQIDPKVRLVDILSVGPEECERILTEANVSVVDFDCLNDDRFTALANTLGISMSEGISDDSLDFEDNHTIKEELLDESDVKEDDVDVGAEVVKTVTCNEEETMDVSDLSKMEFMVKDEVGADSEEEQENDFSKKRDSSMDIEETSPENIENTDSQGLDDVMKEVMEEIKKQPDLSSDDSQTKGNVNRQESNTTVTSNVPSEDFENSIEGQQFITVDTWSPNEDS